MTLLNLIWEKVNVWGLVALGVLAFLFKYGQDKKQEGAAAATSKINEQSQKVQDAWEKIDRTDPTVDQSLDRLRNRISKD